MITLFEEYKLEPKLGDYVYTPNLGQLNKEIGNVLNNTVGQIIEVRNLPTSTYDIGNSYVIKYECDNINSLTAKYALIRKNDEKSFKIEFGQIWIKYFSENKEDVEAYIAAKKYNL